MPEDRVMIDGNEELLLPAGVPECLVDERKRMRRLGQGHAGNSVLTGRNVIEMSL